MKCPYCGGEVSSQSPNCPYCGAVNPEGVAFQEEIQKRIERNKLLKPFLIKQKTPELMQRMLSRILLILVEVNVLLFVFSVGIYIWGEREQERTAAQGSQAQRYETIFPEVQNYYYDKFVDDMNEMIDLMEEGQVPDREDILTFLDHCYDMFYYMQSEPEELKEEAYFTMKAFFMGYVGLTKEEAACFEPKEDGSYDRFIDDGAAEQIALIMEERMKEAVK